MSFVDQEERISHFISQLEKVMDVTANQLNERFEFQKTALAKQFPLLMSSLWVGSENLKPDDTIESVINQGTLGIGFIGLAEALTVLTGKHHAESDDAQKLGLEIIGFMRKKCDEFASKFFWRKYCFPGGSRRRHAGGTDF